MVFFESVNMKNYIDYYSNIKPSFILGQTQFGHSGVFFLYIVSFALLNF